MSSTTIIIKRIYRMLFYTAALLIVVSAVLVSLARVLLSNVDTYQEDIEKLASAYLNHAVKIETIDARIIGLTPTLIFQKVRLMDDTGQNQLVAFDEAQVGMAVLPSWQGGKFIPSSIVVDGIELAISRQVDDSIFIQGVDISTLGGDAISTNADKELTDWLFNRTGLVLKNSVIIWKDIKRGQQSVRFDQVNLQIQNEGDRHYIKGKVLLPKQYGKQLDVAVDVTGNMRLPMAWQGQLYLKANAVKVDEWSSLLLTETDTKIYNGLVDVEVWADIDHGSFERMSGDVSIYDLEMTSPYVRKKLGLKYAGGLFDFQLNGKEWSFAMDQFQVINNNSVWPVSRFGVFYTNDGEFPPEYHLTAEHFRVDDVTQLLLQTTLIPEKIDKLLRKARPSGDITQLSIDTYEDFSSLEKFQLQAYFDQVNLNSVDTLPGVKGISGSVWANQETGEIKLSSQYASVNIPELFRNPIPLSYLDAFFYWQKTGKRWHIWSDQVTAHTPAIKSLSQVLLEIPIASDASPYIDLQVTFEDGDASQAGIYYPVAIMDKELITWADNGIQSGHVIEGGAVLRGRLSDFPFTKSRGQFLAEFTGEDMVLNYQPGWPKLSKGKVAAKFTSSGVHVDVKSAQILNTQIKSSKAAIPDFLNPQLVIDGKAQGSLEDLAHYLVNSPISPESRDFVYGSTLGGNVDTTLHLTLPISDEMEKVAPLGFSGIAKVHDGSIKMWNDKLKINELNGEVHFSETKERARNIKGKIFGEEILIDLISRYRGDDLVMSVIAQTELDIKDVLSLVDIKANNKLDGRSKWQAVFTSRHHDDEKAIIPPSLKLTSDLYGASLDLPYPLQKEKEATNELSVKLVFADQTNVLVNYDNQFSTIFDYQENKAPDRIGFHFGKGNANLPDKKKVLITGSNKKFIFSHWRQAVHEYTPLVTNQSSPLKVVLDMETLAIVEDENEQSTETEKISPNSVSLFSGKVNDFYYNDISLGQLKLDTSRIRRGIKLEQLELKAPLHHFTATGQWKSGFIGDATQMNILLKSPDAGNFMKSLGFAAKIKGGTLNIDGDLAWPDSPHNISMKKIMGNLHLEIKDGSVLDVDAGAGRLLGLFSLNELPRRLSLDFQDTFSKGFSFDEIKAVLKLKDGSAFTKNFVTTSPVATISIAGRTGYVDQDFDQFVTVIPEVGGTLPLAGGLIFGLEIGVAIMVIDQILGQEINKAGLKKYHLTGSWENPVVTDVTPVQQLTEAEDEE